MKHILITGGNGFIGQYVVEEVAGRGYTPVVYDRKFGRLVREKPELFDTVWGDIKDQTLVDEAVGHVEGVIHLAGVLGTQETVADPKPAAETNILGGLNVVMACAKYDVPLVNIAVGNFWMNNTYSITKNAVERFVDMKATFEGARMASVRALNAYGPRQVPAEPYGPSRVRKIMPSFICRALSDDPIEIYGDGEQVMDMIYVTDVANVLVSALETLDEKGRIESQIEAGTGEHTTVNDIADAVHAEVFAQTGIDADIKHLPMRKGEPDRSVVVGNPKTLKQVGVDPKGLVTLAEGVQSTVDYFRKYLKER